MPDKPRLVSSVGVVQVVAQQLLLLVSIRVLAVAELAAIAKSCLRHRLWGLPRLLQ
jgi:hypothetical protein